MSRVLQARTQSPDGHRFVGHAHFWKRAMSRGQFIRTAAGAGGGALTSALWMPALTQAAKPVPAAPSPIPGGVTPPFLTAPIHTNPPPQLGPTVAHDPSMIFDFNGFIGVAQIDGTGRDGSGNLLYYDVDNRFMQGTYVGVDGKTYHATFGFI